MSNDLHAPVTIRGSQKLPSRWAQERDLAGTLFSEIPKDNTVKDAAAVEQEEDSNKRSRRRRRSRRSDNDLFRFKHQGDENVSPSRTHCALHRHHTGSAKKGDFVFIRAKSSRPSTIPKDISCAQEPIAERNTEHLDLLAKPNTSLNWDDDEVWNF